MMRLRAVPSRAWSAVIALVILASVGISVVLGAGLHVWQDTVGSAPTRLPSAPAAPGSGVVTVPGATPSRPHQAPPPGRAPAPAAPAPAVTQQVPTARPTVPSGPRPVHRHVPQPPTVQPPIVPPPIVPPPVVPPPVVPPPVVQPPVVVPPVVQPPVVVPPAVPQITKEQTKAALKAERRREHAARKLAHQQAEAQRKAADAERKLAHQQAEAQRKLAHQQEAKQPPAVKPGTRPSSRRS